MDNGQNQRAQLLTSAQPGLTAEHGNAHFLEMTIKPGVSAEALKQAIALALLPMSEAYVSVAFGSTCWDMLQPAWRPQDLRPFDTLTAQYAMPASQADLLFWIRDDDQGEVMASVLHITASLEQVVDIQLDIRGFKNRESRDLTGFVDGTANPKDDERYKVAQLPAGTAGAGGSYVFSQQWRHKLKDFTALAVKQQEQVIGRTKVDNIELQGGDMPVDSHVSRTDVKVDGVGMKIYRRSTPYYTSAEDRGLLFICFACDIKRISVQLERMVGATADGVADKLMQYSTPLTGSYWFMPGQADLLQLLKQEQSAAE